MCEISLNHSVIQRLGFRVFSVFESEIPPKPEIRKAEQEPSGLTAYISWALGGGLKVI